MICLLSMHQTCCLRRLLTLSCGADNKAYVFQDVSSLAASPVAAHVHVNGCLLVQLPFYSKIGLKVFINLPTQVPWLTSVPASLTRNVLVQMSNAISTTLGSIGALIARARPADRLSHHCLGRVAAGFSFAGDLKTRPIRILREGVILTGGARLARARYAALRCADLAHSQCRGVRRL